MRAVLADEFPTLQSSYGTLARGNHVLLKHGARNAVDVPEETGKGLPPPLAASQP